MDYIKSSEDFFASVNSEDFFTLCVFSAEWCGPCKMLSQVLDQYRSDCIANKEKINVIKVNVDSHSDIAAEYNVSSIPTLILFNGGRAIADRTGFVSKDELHNWVSNYI